MKRLALLIVLVVTMLSLMGAVAFAGGWSTISNAAHSPDTGVWGTAAGGGGSPHGNFSATTNKCRVCHAVHMADMPRAGGDSSTAASWRLLGNSDRLTECNFCHGDLGATGKRPYGAKNYAVKGEHTLGSTVIPDASGGTLGAGGLSCGDCHSVHGSGTLQGVGASSSWDSKILRQNPNKEGGALNAGGAGSTENDNSTENGKKTNFCADCHNANPNWDTDDAGGWAASRPNSRSHVQGPAAQGSLEVYGTTMTVAGWGTIDGNGDGGSQNQNTAIGCRGCHAAAANNTLPGGWVAGVSTSNTASAFPHQTKGAKLLFDTFSTGTTQQVAGVGGSGSYTNDANRVLPAMDQLCAKCHRNTGDFTGAQGVGQTF